MRNDKKECATHWNSSLVGIIFSKDRAMQLDAVLRSLYFQCKDMEQIHIKVLYITSTEQHEHQYNQLMDEYPEVTFIKETHFKQQLLECIKGYDYVLFLVDDNLFVRPFSLQNMTYYLEKSQDVLGFSLRLGTNTTYCYMLNCPQKLPDFTLVDEECIEYSWPNAEHDFQYSLEISSSIYRLNDLFPTLEQLDFTNPNTLEAQLAGSRNQFTKHKNQMICYKKSLVFGTPINMVQTEFLTNKMGASINYSINELCSLFSKGYRIDIQQYNGYEPKSCHEEVSLFFTKILAPPMVDASHEEIIRQWFEDNGDHTLRLNYDLSNESVVFDIGGFKGQWASDIFSRYCCNIHVFEPVPSFCDQITKRFCKNPSIYVYDFGLAGSTCHSTISLSGDASSIFKTATHEEQISINLVNIKEFIENHDVTQIDLMKINIEGGEYDLLESLLENNLVNIIKNIQIQFHNFFPEAQQRMVQIQNQLRKTHVLTYQYPFVWENWLKKNNTFMVGKI